MGKTPLSAFRLAPLALILACAGVPATASAGPEFAVSGGLSFGSGEGTRLARPTSPHFGLEFTAGFADAIQLGGFVDQNWQAYEGGAAGPLQFFGAVVRFSPNPFSGFYFDGKLGAVHSSRSLGSLDITSDFSVGLGAGAGYHFGLTPLVRIGPRFGMRSLPLSYGDRSFSRVLTDFSLLLTIGL
ncbi:MAG: hypothetical protein NDJ90_09760 [Oligoflexia bacterium]|nr:hypothetical protein [Oligoflexia bacterium]